MYGSAQAPDDSDRTAFRKAEKKYKLYKNSSNTNDINNNKKKKTNKSSSKRQEQAKEVDLSEVVDFKSVLESFNQNGETPNGIFELQSDFDRPVFCLKDRPGFYFISGALSVEEQCHWIRESLGNFPQPPNRTNHNAIYGPVRDLFLASQRQKYLFEVETSVADEDSTLNSSVSNGDGHRWQFDDETGVATRQESCKAVAASALLRKLRWSTLGLQFDWSKRNYNISLPHNKIPEKLSQLAKRMARPAMPTGEEFQSEAAIVNYFGAGDMLGGHLDDMEADWSKPIVSISLGCKAIFLLGGKSREEPPTAMFLRSGDVVLMAGQARECFHGVPRIFTDKENAEISELDSRFSHQDDLCFMEYIRTSRININIRQVF